ncbi:hypothetical protein BHE74_00045850 [Ensete ventricosum]|nr:hypothetical protein BHE74_00045850 [Ensete ventricosum]RZS21354.1 hypothetical protein BHM03_00053980 [Ensete ventricosum]
MLNSANKDRIFSSIRLSKISNLVLMASSDAMVYASRSIILRSFFCCQMKGRSFVVKIPELRAGERLHKKTSSRSNYFEKSIPDESYIDPWD